jgi:hypothetical protein
VNDNRDSLAAQQAAGLRKLADFIEHNPGLATHCTFDMINVFVDGPAEIRDAIRAGLGRGAKVNKTAKGDFFAATLEWGPVVLHVNARREAVCEKVVVGTREVTEEVPDPEALAAVPTVTVTRTEPVTEWRCNPILAAGTEAAVAS